VPELNHIKSAAVQTQNRSTISTFEKKKPSFDSFQMLIFGRAVVRAQRR
jgi:hypothetical protein